MWFIYSGGLTGPVFFALAFDNSCDLWDEHCGEKGACLAYNTNQMAINMAALCMSVKLASLIFMLIAWKFYKPPQQDEQAQIEATSDTDKYKGDTGKDNGCFISSQDDGIDDKSQDKNSIDFTSHNTNYLKSDEIEEMTRM